MTAELIQFSEPVPGIGGEFEKLCFRTLRDALPNNYLIATNVPLARGSGAFYECDAIIIAPGICDILELKCIKPYVVVHEDLLVGINEYSCDRVFSILDSKGKVLSSRTKKSPFPRSIQANNLWIKTFVVVPDNCEIKISYQPYQTNPPIRQLKEIAQYYCDLTNNNASYNNRGHFAELFTAWKKFCDMSRLNIQRNNRYIGRYLIKRRLESTENTYEYLATDEPPCQVDVHLKEYPFDSVATADRINIYLKHVSREMQTLRQIRHPYIACIIGHFQTGSSLVQVSDWFQGKPLEDIWLIIKDVPISQKIDFFLKVVQAMAFCHAKGVFHRALSASAILVNESLDDLRITSFEFAKDLNRSTTLTAGGLSKRDPRLIPPEEFTHLGNLNYRLSDIFQAGLLFYRLLENGAWPFEDTLTYLESKGKIGQMGFIEDEPELGSVQDLVMDMLSLHPKSRPDPLAKVEGVLRTVLAQQFS